MTALDDISTHDPTGNNQRPGPVKRTLFGGPASEAIGERPAFGPMKRLTHGELLVEQQRQIDTPRRDYSRSAKLLFSVVDLAYGKERTFEKFRVIEVVARVPYMAWETWRMSP